MSKIFHVTVKCIDCGQEVVWAHDEPQSFLDPEYDFFRCLPCVKRVDPYDSLTKICQHCGCLYENPSAWSEACSRECGLIIDEAVERAVRREYDAIERRLEALGA